MTEHLNCIIYSTLGLNKKTFVIRVYGLAVAWALALIVMDYFTFYEVVEVISTPSNNEIYSAFLFLLITTPLFETLVFQWLIQGLLRHAQGSPSFSIVGSSIIFSLVHLNNSALNAIVVLALGFALALTYEYVRMRVGNFYAFVTVVIAHSLWNVFATIGIPFLFLGLGLE